MSEPADNPYQSPRGVEAPNTERRAKKQPLWVRCFQVVLAVVLGVVISFVIYGAVVLVANLGVRYVGRGWTVLGFATLGISAIVLGLVGKLRKRLKRDDR